MTTGVPELVKTARDRFKQGQDARKDQLARELQSLRFYNDDQWPEEIRNLRNGTPANANNGQPAVPARPCITINRVKEPVKQVTNQMRSSEMGAEIVPADDFGDVSEVDDDEIELREGLLRRIQRAPETADAILWMGERAAIAGTGYMGVMTRYLSGKTFDQEPYVCRFYNQSSVTLDPAHDQPDGSDAEWGIVGSDMVWGQYSTEFGEVDGKKNRVCSMTDDEFRGLGDDAPSWFENNGDNPATRMCRVVDYYYTVRKSRELCELPDGRVFWKDELPEGATARQTRHVVEKSIKWAKLDGCQILDQGDWAGPDIPIIKCLGEEIQPYDAERRAVGMVGESAQGANRGGNYMISKLVETVGLAPIPPLMMANGQDEGFESEYQSMNTRTLGVLHYNHKDADGTPIGPPTRPPVDTQIGPTVTALQFFNEAVLSVVGQPSPTLGEVDPSIKTKGGLERLLNQAQHGNSNYLDNLAKSVRRMAVILNGLFYPLYGQKPGRLARIVNGEGAAETVRINAPEEHNITPGGPLQQGPAAKKSPKSYRLTKEAHFNIAVKVTKNYETRRDQESSMLGELIGANPEFMTWFGDKFLKNTDIPDHKELSERAKVMLAPPIQAMLAEKESGQPIPPHAQAKLAKAEEVISQLTQANEQLLKERETDGIKQQADTRRAQMDNDTRLQIEQIKAASTLAKQEAVEFFKQQLEIFKAEQATITREDEQRHELSLKAADAALAEKAAEEARRHDANMGRQSVEAGELSGQAGHQRTLEQGEKSHAQNLEAQASKPKIGGGA